MFNLSLSKLTHESIGTEVPGYEFQLLRTQLTDILIGVAHRNPLDIVVFIFQNKFDKFNIG